jgi:hypothetical protein
MVKFSENSTQNMLKLPVAGVANRSNTCQRANKIENLTAMFILRISSVKGAILHNK